MGRLGPNYDFTLQATLISWVACFLIYLYLKFYHPPFDWNFNPLFGYLCGVLVYFLWTGVGKHRVSKKLIKTHLIETKTYSEEIDRAADAEKLWSGSEIATGFLGVGFGCIWMLLVFK